MSQDNISPDYSGLSVAEAAARLKQYGPNDVEEKKSGMIKKLLAPLYSPISLMLLAAATLSRLNGRIFDFYFIIALYFVNYSIQKWQEFKADRAIQELQSRLAFDVSTKRDDKWAPVSAKELVPGDRIRLGLGSIIPADGQVVVAKNLSTNEAVLTGESLPKEKKVGDKIFSGAFLATGSLEAVVTATGRQTSFGKTIFSIEQPAGKSILEKDIMRITRFLTFASLIAVAILSAFFLIKGVAITDLLTLDLSLVIAGIPIALPAVMAIILSIGAAGLAKKLVVVRRLSALQDLANVNLLLSDKTGTLTKNEIRVTNIISYSDDLTGDDVIEYASYAAPEDTPDAIDAAVTDRFKATARSRDGLEILSFTPYDGDRKRATAIIRRDGKTRLISLGAPQIIKGLGHFIGSEREAKFAADIKDAAAQGYRVMAVAFKDLDDSALARVAAAKTDAAEEKDLTVIGLLFLADPLDETSKETIAFMREHGIGVRMLTGDNQTIAERIAQDLGMTGEVLSAEETRKFYASSIANQEQRQIAAFAEIMPKDKYELVKAYKARHYIVAATGDGVNDLPALKVANVGIAVSNAVSALKSLADIVLLGTGLSVIKDAVIESRKIFVRLYNYTIYRISESFRLIITILVLGLIYGSYPLLPLQIILLAFMNDIPIISLAVDRVKISTTPSAIKVRERFGLSLLFGLVGIFNSLIMFFLTFDVFHLPIGIIQTMFFLKLTVSGHALIFVAHTKERWWKFLPAKAVIIATLTTQALATLLAITGFMMPTAIPWQYAALIWVWCLLWMQVTELMKDVQARFIHD